MAELKVETDTLTPPKWHYCWRHCLKNNWITLCSLQSSNYKQHRTKRKHEFMNLVYNEM